MGKSWKTLDRTNRQVNDFIEPISNLDHWGTLLDHWDYRVDGKGDCKIYPLYKRKLLLEDFHGGGVDHHLQCRTSGLRQRLE